MRSTFRVTVYFHQSFKDLNDLEKKKQHSHSIWVFLGHGYREHLLLMLDFSPPWQFWTHFPQASIALRMLQVLPSRPLLNFTSHSSCFVSVSTASPCFPHSQGSSLQTAFLSYPAPSALPSLCLRCPLEGISTLYLPDRVNAVTQGYNQF